MPVLAEGKVKIGDYCGEGPPLQSVKKRNEHSMEKGQKERF